MKSITLKLRAGYFGGDTSWWTQKDWDDWKEEIAKLKQNGEYGREFETTFNFDSNNPFDIEPNKNTYSNISLLIPKGKLSADSDIPKFNIKSDENKDNYNLL